MHRRLASRLLCITERAGRKAEVMVGGEALRVAALDRDDVELSVAGSPWIVALGVSDVSDETSIRRPPWCALITGRKSLQFGRLALQVQPVELVVGRPEERFCLRPVNHNQFAGI